MINQDELEFELEISNQQDEDEIVVERKDVPWITKDLSIREIHSMVIDGELILQPDYQRDFVATNKISSSLIESLLMNVPIPTVYLSEEVDGTYTVIDGQQRLTSFVKFLSGEFQLSSLRILPTLNRKRFGDLDPIQQKRIKSTTIHSIIIKREADPDIKFEIFERLNTGSTPLNEDELRNTIYRGKLMNLIKDLSDNSLLDKLVQKEDMKRRMKYRGLVTEFISISEKLHLYKSPMKQFCNKELRDNKNPSDEKLRELKERFLKSLDLVNLVFGDKSFRRYVPQTDKVEGKWLNFSYGLYHLQMIGFVKYTKNQILSKADQIREGLLDLMCNNEEFNDLLNNKTNSTIRFHRRFRIYQDMLESIIENPQPRIFPFSIKQSLFDKSPVCALSGQTILSIEDCEVDHIIPYSKGGKTELENAQLVLRYFNRAKRDRGDYDPNVR
jgi:5-methylcytosine-specific restriction endonuclease McrA